MGGRFNSSSVGSAETARCDWPGVARCHLVPSPRVRQRDVAVALGFPLPASPHPRRADAAPSRRAQRRAHARRRSSRPARTRLSAARDPRRPAEPPRGAPRRAREVLGSPLAPVPFDEAMASLALAAAVAPAVGVRPNRCAPDARNARSDEKRAIYTTIARDGGSSTEKAHPYRDPSLPGIHSIDPPSLNRSDRALFVGGAYHLLASASHPPHPAPLVPVLIIIPPTHPPSPFPLSSSAAPPGRRRRAGRRLPRGASLTRCPRTRA